MYAVFARYISMVHVRLANIPGMTAACVGFLSVQIGRVQLLISWAQSPGSAATISIWSVKLWDSEFGVGLMETALYHRMDQAGFLERTVSHVQTE